MLRIIVLTLASLVAHPAAAELRFREVAESWNLLFRHHNAAFGERYLIETMVGGVVVFDYDNDGDEDVLFPDGAALPGYEGEPTQTQLYRNDDGRFVDVAAVVGLPSDVYFTGGVAGDSDGDGDLDLYLTAFGKNRLYENRGDGTFAEITDRAGVGELRWSSSAAFFDPDRDGDLDLYVANYVDFSLDNNIFCGNKETGVQGYCRPDVYNGVPDRYYQNQGDGTFRDHTAAADLVVEVGLGLSAGLGVVTADFDADGWPDIYVSNDLSPNLLFLNQGDGTFRDESLLSGSSYGDRGMVEAGMGVTVGNIDGNALPDIVVGNFALETNAVYLNQGGGLFLDNRRAAGLGDPSLMKLTFGVMFADFDHDGDEDLLMANGHISDTADALGLPTPYRQANQAFEQVSEGRFREVAAGLDVVRASRGLAVGDFDQDGDLDPVFVNSNDLVEVYENLSPAATSGWVTADFVGRESNSYGVGTRVELLSGDRSQWREIRTSASYLSQSALSLDFGIGPSPTIDALAIHWTSGIEQRFLRPPIRRRLRIFEPEED